MEPRLDKQIKQTDKTNVHKKGISFYCSHEYKYIFIAKPKIILWKV